MGAITMEAKTAEAATETAGGAAPEGTFSLRDRLLSLTLEELLVRAASLGVPPSAIMRLLD